VRFPDSVPELPIVSQGLRLAPSSGWKSPDPFCRSPGGGGCAGGAQEVLFIVFFSDRPRPGPIEPRRYLTRGENLACLAGYPSSIDLPALFSHQHCRARDHNPPRALTAQGRPRKEKPRHSREQSPAATQNCEQGQDSFPQRHRSAKHAHTLRGQLNERSDKGPLPVRDQPCGRREQMTRTA